jgi:hypothetical protein
VIHEVPGRPGEIRTRRLVRAREPAPPVQRVQHGRRPFPSKRGAVVGRESARVREVLDPIEARDQFQRIGHATIHVLEGDQLSPSMRETADFEGVGHLSGEEPIEHRRRIRLHVAGPAGEKRPGAGGAFASLLPSRQEVVARLPSFRITNRFPKRRTRSMVVSPIFLTHRAHPSAIEREPRSGGEERYVDDHRADQGRRSFHS